jgi:hypothetical protein
MPKITLKPLSASDEAIAADGARVYLEFSLDSPGDVRWCFGTTFVEADSQLLTPGLTRPFEGSISQQAFSFGPGKGIIDVTTL